MTNDEVTPGSMPRWSAERYARHAAFVPALGTGVVEALAPAEGERILDIGCGDGVLTETIAASGASVVGVDASEAMVAAALARGIDARVADAQRLPFREEFDAAFSNAALHWMPAIDPVLTGVHQALVPGGRFVGELGGHGNVAAIATAIRSVLRARGLDAPAPWYFPTEHEFRDRLEMAGFAVRHIVLFARPTPLPTGIAGWLETFGSGLIDELPEEDRAAAAQEIESLLAPALRDARGEWTADYVRLRFAAHRS